MPLHPDFQKIYSRMVKQYGAKKGKTVFYSWVNKMGYDDTKPFPKSYWFSDSIEIKKEDEEYYVEGIASTVNPDLGNDIVTEEALNEMAETINSRSKINPLSLGYDHQELLGGRPTMVPLGQLLSAKVENGSLKVKGWLNKALNVFKDAKSALDRKDLNSFSIEYQPTKTSETWINNKKHRVINSLNLVGMALTGRPMNQDALLDFYAKNYDFKNMDTKKAFAKAPAGEGSRFAACVARMKGKVKDPRAVCAAIGRKKFGKAKFQKMAAAGKSDIIPDEFYDISDMSDEDINNLINEVDVKMAGEEKKPDEEEKKEDVPKEEATPEAEKKEETPSEEKKEETTIETKHLDYEKIGRETVQKQEDEKKATEFKTIVDERIKEKLKEAEPSNLPLLNPAGKFDVKSTDQVGIQLKNYKEVLNDPKANLDRKYNEAAKLHNSLRPFGIDKRGETGDPYGMSERGGTFSIGGNAMQEFETKSYFEYKALLEHDTDKTEDTNYYQNAAELSDIYDPLIRSHLNDKTTLYGLLRKVDAGGWGDRYGFRVWRTRIEGAGGSTTAYNYDEDDDLTGYHAKMLKCQIPFMWYGVTVEVSGQMIAAARGGGGVGDIFSLQVKRATADLLRGINADFYDITSPSSGMTAGGQILALDYLVDDGGVSTSLYGHTRTAGEYTTLQGTDDAQSGTPNIDKTLLRKAIRTAEKNGAHRNQLFIVTDQIQRDKILGLLDPAQRFNNTSARAGFEGMPTFDGIPIHSDDQCNDGYIYVLPADATFLAVQLAPTYEDLAKTKDTKKGFIKTYFALVCTNPNWTYKISGLKTT